MSCRVNCGSVMLLAALAFTSLAACTPRASGQPGRSGIARPVKRYGYSGSSFSVDDQAMEVLPERREVEVCDPSQRPPMEELVVTELPKGPKDPLLRRTFPTDTSLISVQVTDGLALANFSKELVTKHGGGSTGEMMTILSLGQLPTARPMFRRCRFWLRAGR